MVRETKRAIATCFELAQGPHQLTKEKVNMEHQKETWKTEDKDRFNQQQETFNSIIRNL